MIDTFLTVPRKIYRYHSMACVCRYCLMLDRCIVQEWSAEIRPFIYASITGA